MIRSTQKTPTFTTATACNRALTGVGATMAEGSHECTGTIAALPMPSKKRKNITVSIVSEHDPARMP